jgi:lipid II:glycine glycyltransferase (peptidoglycan interpeptide bridge formation enzyme)
MIVREVQENEKDKFNAVAVHPLQIWEWGEFRKKAGNEVARLASFDGNRLTEAYQMTVHSLPVGGQNIMVFERGPAPTPEMLNALAKYGRERNTVFIKLEPNVAKISGSDSLDFQKSEKILISNGAVPGRTIFAHYSFQVDLTKSEDELLAKMYPKTRYNVRLAEKHGVTVTEDDSQENWEAYWKLTEETTKRQVFYAHNRHYHELLWDTLKPTGIVHLLKAVYQGQTLSTWMLFLFGDVLYYPYGAWSGEHKEVMANNLMMWEAMRWGKTHGAKKFDLWGAAGPTTPPDDPWWGFTKFKEGYGGDLVEFVGSYDLVVNHPMYSLYNMADKLRWKYLRLRKRLPF